MHLFLSPHLDDAVLSCGGLIHRLTRRGEPVTVLSLCAGDPPPGPLSAFAAELHQRWDPAGLHAAEPAFMTALRRQEDLAGLQTLGARADHRPVPDCIYRRDPATGAQLYPGVESIFGALQPADLALADDLAVQIQAIRTVPGGAALYVPLGLGNHVDHQLTRRAAEQAGGVSAYYEDYPYATGEAGLGAAPGQAVLAGLVPEQQCFEEDDLQVKITAILAYHSQLSSFWDGPEAMARAVRRFAESVGGGGRLAERLWRPASPTRGRQRMGDGKQGAGAN